MSLAVHAQVRRHFYTVLATARSGTPGFAGPIVSVLAMNQIFRFSSSVKRDPAIDAWIKVHSGELGSIARHWFDVIRERGDDVRELLHDGHPTACVADAAFAYVNAFTAHVNVGFFHGAELADPEQLLEGSGKYMACEAQARKRRRRYDANQAGRCCIQRYEGAPRARVVRGVYRQTWSFRGNRGAV